MFKLKITNKPEMIKMKCNIEFPDIVLANLQEKEATPTKEKQEIIADATYDGLSKVVVNAIPDEYIIPSGEININSNGTYDVTDKASANVNVPEKVLGTKSITSNGTYKATDDNVDGYSEVVVSTSGVDINDYYDTNNKYSGDIRVYIKEIPMINTENLTTMYQFFSNCQNLTNIPKINTSNVTNMNMMFLSCGKLKTIPALDTSKVTDMSSMFSGCASLIEIPELYTNNVVNMSNMFKDCSNLKTIPALDTSKVTDMSSIFRSCSNLKTIPALDTSKVTDMSNMFYRSGITIIPELNTSNVRYVTDMFYVCVNLITIPKLNFESMTNVSSFLSGANNVVNIGGFENLGAAYSTTQSADYYYYRLDLTSCTKLTHESLMNVINNLYDIKTKGCKVQSLRLGATNLAKLTAEAIQIATSRGWSVS